MRRSFPRGCGREAKARGEVGEGEAAEAAEAEAAPPLSRALVAIEGEQLIASRTKEAPVLANQSEGNHEVNRR